MDGNFSIIQELQKVLQTGHKLKDGAYSLVT